ncbi:MAG: family protein phosphatase [Acidobacteriota bacterium]|jgi:protein phosphatase
MNSNSELDDADPTETPLEESPPPPFSSRVNVDFYGMTDKGHVRSKNEDHFLIVRCGRAVETVLTSLTEDETMPGELYEEAGFGMIVADGVGGVVGGEVASRQAIYTLLSLALHTPDWQFRWGVKERNAVMFRMRDRFRRVNAALMRDAAVHVSRGGMWTTMTAALTQGTDLVIGHIGDSRAYLLHDRKLIKLTHDHREGCGVADADPLSRELSSVLVDALGSPEGECDPQVDDYLLANDDQLLLCTDGLTDMVDDTEIELVLNNAANAKSACRNLIDLSLNNGGRDNVTVIVARYSIPPVTG